MAKGLKKEKLIVKRFVIGLLIALSLAGAAGAQSPPDSCHVYAVDVRAAEEAYKALPPDASAEAQAKALSTVMKILGQFPTVVGEEELTTRSFPLPGSKLIVTASVFYTDESMPAESITLGLVVSDKAEKDAIAAPDSAASEVNYDANTKIVRVRKRLSVNGRPYLIGLQCDHNLKTGAK